MTDNKTTKFSKKHIIIVATIITTILVSIIVGVIINNYSQKNEAEFNSEQLYSDYTEINDDAIQAEEKYITDGFVAPENIQTVLDEVEEIAKDYKSEGIIKSYERQSTSIYFEFNNGIGYLYTPTVKELLSGDEVGKILTVEPYATSSDFVGNYLISGKSPDKMADKISNILPDSYSFSDEDNWDTFSFEQTEELGDHKIILWYGHGGYVSKYGSVLGTSIPIKDQSSLLLYQLELSNGEMILGKDCFNVSPAYFEKHIADNSLQGSMVFLGACQSAMDNRLADVFIKKGASLVVGNSETIRIRYMLYMMDDFISALTNQYDDGTYWTAEDALAYAKEENGDSDSEFWAYGAEVKLIYPESKSGYRLYGYTSSTPSNNTTSDVPTSPKEPEIKLSESCDMLLCTGYDGDNYYELVANQIDGYPDSTFEFGVIKNNTWLVPMSSNCPFINEKGWWKGAEYGNNPGEFKYMNAGCFYYSHDDGIGLFEMIYKPETGKYFEVSGLVSFAIYKTDFGEVDYSKLCTDSSEFLTRVNDGHWAFSYINLNTGETKAIPLRLYVNNNQDIGLLSDGLFYAYGGSNFTGTDYCGFFDLNGNQIIDLTQYDTTDLKDRQFHNGKYTVTCANSSGVEFDITFDTSGKIIEQTKTTE